MQNYYIRIEDMPSLVSHKLSIIKYVVLKKIIFYFLCFDRLIWTWTWTWTRTSSVPRCRCKTKGGRDFSAAAPKLWNSLPVNVRLAPSLASFKSALKSYLFSLAFE